MERTLGGGTTEVAGGGVRPYLVGSLFVGARSEEEAVAAYRTFTGESVGEAEEVVEGSPYRPLVSAALAIARVMTDAVPVWLGTLEEVTEG